MYRLLLLFLFVGLGEGLGLSGHRYSYRPRRWHCNTYDRRFSILANHVIAADRALREFCKQNANCNVREVYEEGAYKLIYFIPKCSVDYISVKIKHRVLYMSARQVFTLHRKIFVDMRILPDLLKIRNATWSYNDGNLEISIPYKVDFKSEFEATCGEIDTKIISVRRVRNHLDFRFGDDEAGEGDDGDYEDEIDIYDTTTVSDNVSETNLNTDAALMNVTESPDLNSDSDRLFFSS